MGFICNVLEIRAVACNMKDEAYKGKSYPVRNMDTRKLVGEVKSVLAGVGSYLSGRFADWEHYYMDAAIGVAMDLCGNM